MRASFGEVPTLCLCSSSLICKNGTKPESSPCFALLPFTLSPLPVARPSSIIRSAIILVGRHTEKNLDGCSSLTNFILLSRKKPHGPRLSPGLKYSLICWRGSESMSDLTQVPDFTAVCGLSMLNAFEGAVKPSFLIASSKPSSCLPRPSPTTLSSLGLLANFCTISSRNNDTIFSVTADPSSFGGAARAPSPTAPAWPAATLLDAPIGCYFTTSSPRLRHLFTTSTRAAV
mmetsp:Transcript_92574/g.264516  ORF Transcript_92574/g.264516 Transcript_92574/m.264516 type:complete len:231 (+) Transcript_92574:67-759(+)